AQKALLLAGSPGTGKTSTAYSAAAHADYHVLEFNASDARSQSRLRQLRDLVTGISIGRNSLVRQKLLILMDEVDGMSSGDRGGVAELCTLIQLSRHPILLTCNDCNSLKMRPLLVYVVVKQLFSEAAALTPARAASYYFTDYSVMPLFVEENG
uniref:Replication factor C subunit 1-like n=1 Tax=Dermatophagoides pteronyssinus TaxID=6956 RepID=A0A6P6YIQ4_DERPT